MPLKSPVRDYEDAVIYEAAKDAGTNMIVTRNERDFPVKDTAVYGPSKALNIINKLLLQEESLS